MCGYLPLVMPIQQGCTQAAPPKKQHIVKTSATVPNKSKKRKRFFSFLLDLKQPHIACVPSVTSAKRDATLRESEKAQIRAQKPDHAKLIGRRNLSG
jgi:hypothetical protein